MLVDATPIDGRRLDMLEFRMRILYDEVDFFIVCEANRTTSGIPKPFFAYGKDFAERFAWAKEKLVIQRAFLNGDNATPHEEFAHRVREGELNRAIEAACVGFQDTDLIMISNLDEVPKLEVVQAIKADPVNLPKTCFCTMLRYNMRFKHLLPPAFDVDDWPGTVFATMGQMRRIALTGLSLGKHLRFWNKIPSAGWHFSLFGSKEELRERLIAGVERWYKTEDELTDECLQQWMDEGKLGGRDEQLIPIGPEFFPDYVLTEAKKFNWI
jgi:hypothetical protein